MELLLEILLEPLIAIIGEILVEAVLHKFARIRWVRRTTRVVATAIMYFGVGLVVGFFSVLIFSKPFVRSSTLHGISLLITPGLGGVVMSYIAWLRVRTWDWTIRIETFFYGFVFAFAIALLRLLLTQ